MPVIGTSLDGREFHASVHGLHHAAIAGEMDTDMCLHLLLTGLLLSLGPQDARLLLVDSERAELALYEGVPHLLLPLARGSQSMRFLRLICREEQRRIELLAARRERDIASYNAWAPCAGLRPLPRIIVAISELAEIMCDAGAEGMVQRLAQLGPAAGVHLIAATRFPRRDVLTSRIMINIPIRYALRTASEADSRIILGTAGAESLPEGEILVGGYGFSHPGAPVQRVRACPVSRRGIEGVVRFWKDCDGNAPDSGLPRVP